MDNKETYFLVSPISGKGQRVTKEVYDAVVALRAEQKAALDAKVEQEREQRREQWRMSKYIKK
jgi:hypothetical protein